MTLFDADSSVASSAHIDSLATSILSTEQLYRTDGLPTDGEETTPVPNLASPDRASPAREAVDHTATGCTLKMTPAMAVVRVARDRLPREARGVARVVREAVVMIVRMILGMVDGVDMVRSRSLIVCDCMVIQILYTRQQTLSHTPPFFTCTKQEDGTETTPANQARDPTDLARVERDPRTLLTGAPRTGDLTMMIPLPPSQARDLRKALASRARDLRIAQASLPRDPPLRKTKDTGNGKVDTEVARVERDPTVDRQASLERVEAETLGLATTVLPARVERDPTVETLGEAITTDGEDTTMLMLMMMIPQAASLPRDRPSQARDRRKTHPSQARDHRPSHPRVHPLRKMKVTGYGKVPMEVASQERDRTVDHPASLERVEVETRDGTVDGK